MRICIFFGLPMNRQARPDFFSQLTPETSIPGLPRQRNSQRSENLREDRPALAFLQTSRTEKKNSYQKIGRRCISDCDTFCIQER